MTKLKKKSAKEEREERLRPILQVLGTLDTRDLRTLRRSIVSQLKLTSSEEAAKFQKLCGTKFPPGTAVTYNTKILDPVTNKWVLVPMIATVVERRWRSGWAKLDVKDLSTGRVRQVPVSSLKTYDDVK